ncbi:MAG: hypothetical protein AAGE52_25970 [Myxococcota bacterium]
MKSAFLLILAFCLGCPSSNELLWTPDGGTVDGAVDGATADAAADAGGCVGAPPPDGCATACATGALICQEDVVNYVCDDGSWVCPPNTIRSGDCDALVPLCPGTDCAPMEARTILQAEPLCGGITAFRYYWDGRACRSLGEGCGYSFCEGSECDALYDNIDSCRADHAGCVPMPCEAMDVAELPGDCDGLAFSWFWNGYACQRIVDCDCTGSDCGATYGSQDACESARATCIAPCDATDARVTGCLDPGPEDFYYVWNGSDCDVFRSCAGAPECDGTECDEVFGDLESCRDAYLACIGPADVRASLTCELSEDDLVTAALRMGNCGFSPNDVIGGYYELSLALPFRSPNPGATVTCEEVRCGLEAESCDAFQACLDRRRGDECTPSRLDHCIGSVVHSCDRETNTLVRENDCAVLGGTCELEETSGDRVIATCDTPGNGDENVVTQTYCDGDELIVTVGGETVRISCPGYLAGTTCREILYASEFPGFVCGKPDPTCSEYATSSVDCDGDEAILCVGGRERRVDCIAEGYRGCGSLGCED